ncbi:helix-turn-helix domain-containing protein [Rhizobium laguerreae]|uniref:Helix-turn-helix transcriptional regulator n=1 Tax=Rhizobium laguerreae TaxID=1076926 RepID=A0A7Y2R6Z1_9HYPH|nr:winged helix-turn-helix transcriptional regulator [Rhizobium laguerreae]NDK51391.1 helix-turn-helix transcriptional regulator [Rhizobium laguerreae]NNH58301.1 helix-turn-helix transcriptional regulator [Rhizobium laguerreae]NNH65293.1 helix-turn-helix transcriptional regulator [Rhizobium laguerreae]
MYFTCLVQYWRHGDIGATPAAATRGYPPKPTTRRIFAEVPPRVEYALTPAAYKLAPVFDGLVAWWQRHKMHRIVRLNDSAHASESR